MNDREQRERTNQPVTFSRERHVDTRKRLKKVLDVNFKSVISDLAERRRAVKLAIQQKMMVLTPQTERVYKDVRELRDLSKNITRFNREE